MIILINVMVIFQLGEKLFSIVLWSNILFLLIYLDGDLKVLFIFCYKDIIIKVLCLFYVFQ